MTNTAEMRRRGEAKQPRPDEELPHPAAAPRFVKRAPLHPDQLRNLNRPSDASERLADAVGGNAETSAHLHSIKRTFIELLGGTELKLEAPTVSAGGNVEHKLVLRIGFQRPDGYMAVHKVIREFHEDKKGYIDVFNEISAAKTPAALDRTLAKLDAADMEKAQSFFSAMAELMEKHVKDAERRKPAERFAEHLGEVRKKHEAALFYYRGIPR